MPAHVLLLSHYLSLSPLPVWDRCLSFVVVQIICLNIERIRKIGNQQQLGSSGSVESLPPLLARIYGPLLVPQVSCCFTYQVMDPNNTAALTESPLPSSLTAVLQVERCFSGDTATASTMALSVTDPAVAPSCTTDPPFAPTPVYSPGHQCHLGDAASWPPKNSLALS